MEACTVMGLLISPNALEVHGVRALTLDLDASFHDLGLVVAVWWLLVIFVQWVMVAVSERVRVVTDYRPIGAGAETLDGVG